MSTIIISVMSEKPGKFHSSFSLNSTVLPSADVLGNIVSKWLKRTIQEDLVKIEKDRLGLSLRSR